MDPLSKVLKGEQLPRNAVDLLRVTSYQRCDTYSNRIVFTNGCFDPLHVGHVRFLAAARALGDVLVVGINSDASVGRIKGLPHPFMPAADRAIMLAGLESVDLVFVFEADTPINAIRAISPDIIAKGGDYAAEDVVGFDMARVAILPFHEGYSSSAMLRLHRGMLATMEARL